jgi:beta-lactamase superfamily II metal-dependent hydrolase
MNGNGRVLAGAACLAALAFFTSARTLPGEPPGAPSASSSNLTIYAVDVGQGDSALILFPDGSNMLIDTGTSSGVAGVIGLCQRLGITRINKVLITHADSDHSGGYGRLQKEGLINGATARFDYDNTVPEQILHSGPDLAVTCVASKSHIIDRGSATYGSDENDLSVGVVVRYRGFDYLSCGDLESWGEGALGEALAARSWKIDVLKVDHHGSKYSSPLAFLQDILPEFAVIMVGDRNTYGHPTRETLNRLNDPTVRVQGIFQTEAGAGGTAPNVHVADGQVVITTDGETYRFTNEGPGSRSFSYGPYKVDEAVHVEQPPHLLITEVAIDAHRSPESHDWVELYLPPDASPVRLDSLHITDLDYVARAATGAVTLMPGDVAILHDTDTDTEGETENDSTGKGANGRWDIFGPFSGNTNSWNSFHDELAIVTRNTTAPAQSEIVDAVVWSDKASIPSADQRDDGNKLIAAFQWGDPVAGSGRFTASPDGPSVGPIKQGYAQRVTTADTDSARDWVISPVHSQGTPPAPPPAPPTPPPAPEPPKSAQIETDSSSYSPGEPLRVRVVIQQILDRPFDAYVVITGPAGVYSVKFGNALSPGVSPTARGVFMLPGGYNEKVLDMPVPDGCAGSYKAIVGLADAGRKVVGVESAFASDMAEFTAR